MQRPDIPLTLGYRELPGFDAAVDNVHYHIGNETVIRRAQGSKLSPIWSAIFAFLTKITSHAPDFFRIPRDGLSEAGFRVEI